MNVVEKQNLVNSVTEDIIEVLTEKECFDGNRQTVSTWVNRHLNELDLVEGDPVDWAETFRSSYLESRKVGSQKPASYLDKLEGLSRPSTEKRDVERSIKESDLHSVASTVLDIPIWNLKRPIKENQDTGVFYECAVNQGGSYKGFENVSEAAKWIKHNYLSLITEIG